MIVRNNVFIYLKARSNPDGGLDNWATFLIHNDNDVFDTTLYTTDFN